MFLSHRHDLELRFVVHSAAQRVCADVKRRCVARLSRNVDFARRIVHKCWRCCKGKKLMCCCFLYYYYYYYHFNN